MLFKKSKNFYYLLLLFYLLIIPTDINQYLENNIPRLKAVISL